MKDLIAYFAPRALVFAALILALKFTVWPTLSLPFPVASWFEPVWHATAAVKHSIIEPATGRPSSSVAESVDLHPSSDSGTGTEPEQFTIEICPASSEPKKPAKNPRSIANRSNRLPAPATAINSKSSRVATSKLP